MADTDSNPSGRSSDPFTEPDLTSAGQIALIVAEYQGLRGEILKLIEMQSQLISLAVLAFGAILGVGLKTQNPGIPFVYPPLALILGIMWLNHSHAISRCAAYLSQELEPRYGGGILRWETFVRQHPLRLGMLGYWGVRSVFMVSSIVAAVAGWALFRGGTVESIVGSTSSVLTTATIVLFLVRREPSPRTLVKEDEAKANLASRADCGGSGGT